MSINRRYRLVLFLFALIHEGLDLCDCLLDALAAFEDFEHHLEERLKLKIGHRFVHYVLLSGLATVLAEASPQLYPYYTTHTRGKQGVSANFFGNF